MIIQLIIGRMSNNCPTIRKHKGTSGKTRAACALAERPTIGGSDAAVRRTHLCALATPKTHYKG